MKIYSITNDRNNNFSARTSGIPKTRKALAKFLAEVPPEEKQRVAEAQARYNKAGSIGKWWMGKPAPAKTRAELAAAQESQRSLNYAKAVQDEVGYSMAKAPYGW